MLPRHTFSVLIITAALSCAHNVSAQAVTVSRSTTGTYTDTGNLITNGSFEANTAFDSATTTIKTSLRGDGTNTGGAANSWQGTWAARPNSWIYTTYGVIGMPNGWSTTINGGAATTAAAVGTGGTANIATQTDADFHGRWVRFDTLGQGQAGGASRPNDLGFSSMYMGTGATRLDNVSSFGTADSRGVMTLNPALAAADVTLLKNGQTRLGQATAGAALGSVITGANISQTVNNLVVNQDYKLSFWVSGEFAAKDNAGNTVNLNTQYSNGSGMVGLTIGGLSGGGLATLGNPLFLAVPDAMSVQKSYWYSVAFTATNASHTFTWTDYGHMDVTPADAFGVASTSETVIDGIMLTAVPEPTTCALVVGAVALGVVGVRRRRR